MMAPERGPANGSNGTPNVHAANGANGANGAHGTIGVNGVNGVNGANGANGANGVNGTNGIDDTGDDAYPIIQATTWNSKDWEESHNSGPSPPLASAVPHPPLKADSAGVTQAFGQFAQLLHTPRRPLPTQNGSGTASARRTQTGFKLDLKYIGWKDVKTFISLIKSKLRGNEPLDDHSMLMERVIQLVAGLPTTSRNRMLLTDQLIDELWYSLDHPVLNYVGDKYIYRSADGSNNNPLYPHLGAAGTTYARSVRPTIMPPGALPDPGLIYDTVMRRSSQGYRKHPNNVSSILWYWATIIIHDLFWTDFRDMSKSMTSSYLDLSPLYGSNQDMQNSIRTFQDGKLKPDSYADKRLQGMPPGVSVLLIMFNRFHNHVAVHLAAINEGGRFTPPPGPRPGLTNPLPSSGESEEADAAERQSEAAWKKYDEDLFQTARLITSGLYINITLVDYVRNIVNLNRCDTTWTLDPRQEMGRDAGTSAGAASGTGNVVSAEFNLCYRWHSCISEKDDKWIQSLYSNLFGKSNITDITTQDMVMGFSKFEKSIPDDPAHRTFNNYQRNPETGRFNDDDLVDCITTSIEDCAGAFGARNVPLSMKPVEILGILQGRRWKVAGLNEFRKHFGLKPYDTFEELNSDPEVAGCLRYLYEHPDFVELYPGIVAEEAKEPMVPGVGIAPTYTISRVVLSDAVCLVRGDRYYTTDYSPRALTNWGYQEVQYDLNINHGCCFYKLFLRAFPNHFKNNSVYAHYPMVIPSENHRILTSLNRAELFSWDRPVFSPYFGGELATQAQKNSAKNGYSNRSRKSHGHSNSNDNSNNKTLHSGNDYEHVWDETITQLVGKKHVKISPSRMRLSGEGWEQDVAGAYTQMIEQLLQEQSFGMAGSRSVDVVRDVGNAVCVQFVSRLFNLPLKTPSNPKGIYTLSEMHAVMRLIYINTYLDIDPVKSFPLRQATKTVADQLGQLIEQSVSSTIGGSAKNGSGGIAARGADIVRTLSKQGMSAADIAWGQVFPTAVTEVPGQAATFALAVDFYLSPLGKSHLPHLYRLACEPASEETDAQLLGFALEAIRLTSLQTHHDSRSAKAFGEEGGRRDSFDPMLVSLRPGSLSSPSATAAEIMDPQRPIANYVIPAAEAYLCLGREVFFVTLTVMFRAVFRLKNLRRAPGPQGELKKVDIEQSAYSMYLTEDWISIVPLPCSMRVCWDE